MRQLLGLAAFTLMAAPPAAAADGTPLLPRIDGWALAEGSRAFGPATLYEHIDGACELYLSYGFESLVVAEYRGAGRATIRAEVYRHGSPVQAFGIYSQERPREGHYLQVGAEGYVEPPILNFFVGSTYVKLDGDSLAEPAADTLRGFAAALGSALGGETRLPAVLAHFPNEGRIPHSERFASQDFLGYGFLRSAYSADYRVGEARFQLFVIAAGAQGEAGEALRQYLQAAGQPGEGPGAAAQVVQDRYNGEVGLIRTGRFLCGVVGLPDAKLRDRYLEALRASIAAAP